MRIGLLTVATGKYIDYALALTESVRRLFLAGHEVTIYIFTDAKLVPASQTVPLPWPRLGWPDDTLRRYHAYLSGLEVWQRNDYIYAFDADMLIVDSVEEEILGTLVGTQHPGFVGRRGTYENRPDSQAYVADSEGATYFCGGFLGGSTEAFKKLARAVTENVDADAQRDITAVWHDESHINRYFIDCPPTVVLSPSYCYPESWNLSYPRKILALDKNHVEMRRELLAGQ